MKQNLTKWTVLLIRAAKQQEHQCDCTHLCLRVHARLMHGSRRAADIIKAYRLEAISQQHAPNWTVCFKHSILLRRPTPSRREQSEKWHLPRVIEQESVRRHSYRLQAKPDGLQGLLELDAYTGRLRHSWSEEAAMAVNHSEFNFNQIPVQLVH